MKVIDLLNMMANKEKMPKKIMINRMVYIYNNSIETYIDEYDGKMIIDFTNNVLNMDVKNLDKEIDKEIDIQSIDEIPSIIHINATDEYVAIALNNIIEQHNELLQAVKYLDNKLNKEYCQNCGVELTSDNKYMNGMCTECKYGED